MADSVQRHGRDTFVSTDIPNAPRGRSEVLLLQSGVARVYVYQPMPGIRGRRIEQAILSDPVKGTAGAQTLTASPVTERWSPADTTYNDQPAVDSGAAVTAAQGALTDGERIEIDVTDHVQAIADGAENWGWRITTDSATAGAAVRVQRPRRRRVGTQHRLRRRPRAAHRSPPQRVRSSRWSRCCGSTSPTSAATPPTSPP
jgi:hypothetical protein